MLHIIYRWMTSYCPLRGLQVLGPLYEIWRKCSAMQGWPVWGTPRPLSCVPCWTFDGALTAAMSELFSRARVGNNPKP